MRSTLLATAALALLVAGCKSKSEVSSARHAVAGPATLRDVARLTGTVAPSDTLQIKSQITQQITRIHVKEGDFVKKGQLLFDLDREQLQLRHEQLLIAVSTAKLGLEAADRDFDRAQSQLKNGSVSTDRVQDLQFARDKARLALQNAQLDLKSNERDLYYTRIVAPRDGQLIHLNVSEGEMAVAANSVSGGVLGVIADPTRLKVVVEVSELDYPRLRMGQSVEISTEAQPDRLLPGHVTYIPPAAQPSSSNSSVMVFRVETTLDKDASPVRLSEVAGGSRGAWGGRNHGADTGKRSGSGGWRRDSSRHGGRKLGVDTAAKARRHAESVADSSNGRLAPGMTVNVDFVFLERKVELAVPYDLVTTSKDGARKMVRIRDERGTHPKPVQVGSTDFKNIEILGGVEVGDTVYAAEEATGSDRSSKRGPGGPP
jgi:RND family efflux transporter MFP subunit